MSLTFFLIADNSSSIDDVSSINPSAISSELSLFFCCDTRIASLKCWEAVLKLISYSFRLWLFDCGELKAANVVVQGAEAALSPKVPSGT